MSLAALKRAFGVLFLLTWRQAVDLRGIGVGPPYTYCFGGVIAASCSRAFTLAARSGSVAMPKVMGIRGLFFEPFGLPLPRGGSAGPNWPDRIRQRTSVR